MGTRIFIDEKAREWIVLKRGSLLKVFGDNAENEPLYRIAQSCARKAGILETKAGIPLDSIKEHRKIWSAIWSRGKTNGVSPENRTNQ